MKRTTSPLTGNSSVTFLADQAKLPEAKRRKAEGSDVGQAYGRNASKKPGETPITSGRRRGRGQSSTSRFITRNVLLQQRAVSELRERTLDSNKLLKIGPEELTAMIKLARGLFPQSALLEVACKLLKSASSAQADVRPVYDYLVPKAGKRSMNSFLVTGISAAEWSGGKLQSAKDRFKYYAGAACSLFTGHAIPTPTKAPDTSGTETFRAALLLGIRTQLVINIDEGVELSPAEKAEVEQFQAWKDKLLEYVRDVDCRHIKLLMNHLKTFAQLKEDQVSWAGLFYHLAKVMKLAGDDNFEYEKFEYEQCANASTPPSEPGLYVVNFKLNNVALQEAIFQGVEPAGDEMEYEGESEVESDNESVAGSFVSSDTDSHSVCNFETTNESGENSDEIDANAEMLKRIEDGCFAIVLARSERDTVALVDTMQTLGRARDIMAPVPLLLSNKDMNLAYRELSKSDLVSPGTLKLHRITPQEDLLKS